MRCVCMSSQKQLNTTQRELLHRPIELTRHKRDGPRRLDVPGEQVRLAHRRIPDQDNLVEVVIVVLRAPTLDFPSHKRFGLGQPLCA